MKYLMMTMATALVASSAFDFAAEAAVRPAAWISDGMVLQRGQEVTLRGQADAGETFVVEFEGAQPLTKAGKRVGELSVSADANGLWSVKLPSLKAGGPYVLKMGELSFSDVMVGDVYLCSGQSNMELPVRRVMDKYAMEINATVAKKVRLLKVELETKYDGPATDVRTEGWKTLNKENAYEFSALGYFFAREMNASQPNVAVGVIQAAVGGTPIEAWMSREQLLADGCALYVNMLDVNADADYRKTVEDYGKAAGDHWEAVLAQKEAALNIDWKAANFDDSKWETVSAVSDAWSHDDIRPFNGAHWFRKTIEVSGSQAALQATLRLGTLVDADEVWVNGTRVGVTYYQYPPRIYDIPQGLLHAGKNTIAVRLVSQFGRPAFVDEKYRGIFFGGNKWLNGSNISKIDLDNEWKHFYAAAMPQKPGIPFFYYTPTVLYNAMIAPLDGVRFTGAVWYQGESNVGRDKEYSVLLKGMMSSWRALFANPDMKFVIVELADFERPVNDSWKAFQQMQHEVAASDPKAAIAEAHDLGEWNDVHPLAKKELAFRVAKAMKSIK